MKKLIFLIFIFIFTSCDNNNLIKEYYDTGVLKKECYIGDNSDTLKIIEYFNNGMIHIEKKYINNSVIEKEFRRKKSAFGSSIITYRKHSNNKIQHFYNQPNFNKLVQKELIVNKKSLGGTQILFENKNRKELFFKRLSNEYQDTLSVYQGVLFYNEKDSLERDKCFGFLIHGMDTIKEDEIYDFKLEFILDKFKVDSVMCIIEIGDLDSNASVITPISEYGGYKKEYFLNIDTPQIGYNLITGTIQLIGFLSVKSEVKIAYNKEMLFYYDFYVKPKEE